MADQLDRNPLRMAVAYVCVDGRAYWACVCDGESMDGDLGPSDCFWWVPGTWETESADETIGDGRAMLTLESCGALP